jgi:hypothetical protein
VSLGYYIKLFPRQTLCLTVNHVVCVVAVAGAVAGQILIFIDLVVKFL